MCERPLADAIRTRFAQLAMETKSPVTRLYLASAAGRLPVEHRLAILEPFLQRTEDASDVNLPLLECYALEPVVGKDPAAGAARPTGAGAAGRLPAAEGATEPKLLPW